MKNERRTNIRVGIVSVVAILALIWIFMWAKNTDIYSENRPLKVRFNSVAGLSAGDIVAVNGVHKGYVSNITLDKQTVLVEIMLEKDVELKKDAVFGIYMLDLMGGKKLEIDPGSAIEPLDYSIIHEGKFTGDISTAMAALSSVQNDLVDAIQDMRATLSSLNSLISDEDFTHDLKSSAKALKNLSLRFSDILAENDTLISSLLSRSKKLIDNSNKFINENQNDINVAIDNLNSTLSSAKELLDKLNEFGYRVENDQNNLGKLLHDDSFIIDLKETISEVKKLLKILNAQIQDEGVKVDANIF